jgi:hypothetical protein
VRGKRPTAPVFYNNFLKGDGSVFDVRIGKGILFDVKDLDRFIEMNKYTLDLVRQKSYDKQGTA